MKTNTCELCNGTGTYVSEVSGESERCFNCNGEGLLKFLECCHDMNECLHIKFRTKDEEHNEIEPGFYIINDETDEPMYTPLNFCPWCGAKI